MFRLFRKDAKFSFKKFSIVSWTYFNIDSILISIQALRGRQGFASFSSTQPRNQQPPF